MSLKDKIKDIFGRPRYCYLREDTNSSLLGCTVERDGMCTQSTMSCTYPCEHMRYEPKPENVSIQDLIRQPSKAVRGVNKK